MKTLTILALILCLSACSPNSDNAHPEKRAFTSNGYDISLLFENEGCKVWRFHDKGYYRYYVVCESSNKTHTQYNHSETQGKVTIEVPEEITTQKK